MTENTTVESSPSITVLYIEDDEFTATRTSRYLERHGLSIRWFSDGRSGLAELIREEPDIVLLDLQIPQMDGLQVCAEIRRRSDVPIIIITAREEEADRVLGLEGGADDYLVKPFSTRELLARIRAHVRRARGRAGPESPVLRVGRITIDPRTYSAALDGTPLRLTTYEFALLKALAERAGRVLSREQMMELVTGSADEAFDRSIDVHISNLRRKLGDDPRQPTLLKTIRGVGYVLLGESS
ncbi:two component transcriptional regulator, winged helix family [Cystobacter fuscus DSM 2262]|uniref:Two component transcriptional regulator, winged helix family n=1 Tax=Cystobacter fuscus (strain ATCC 25194 / DSM 2262 / NBRC 100088 / M29) TaxID=1242864 RepID=S9PI34_CYSF2|nr:response regulator transcription factor [Cystobacter fuscus]EPX62726.1 two component transcriptional regulator, winged helix family [Cystobacter fuscus DSM 2262]